jgi:hypothetical protein
MSDADLRAALSWNPRKLRESKNPGARAFWNAMSLRPIGEEGLDKDHLGLAAVSLMAELQGDPDLAKQGYQKLAKRRSRLARLLGTSLLAWMSDSGEGEIRIALEATQSISHRDIRVVSLCRLLTIALDKGEMEIASQLLREAQEASDESIDLQNTLNWVDYRYFNAPLTQSHAPSKGHDPTEREEIVQLQVTSGRDFVVRQAERNALGPWRPQLRFGRDDNADLFSAEIQAVWSGAIWMLPEIRLHLGAQLLLTGKRPQEFGYGLSSWYLGGGSQLFSIASWAESGFDSVTADTVLKEEIRWGKRAGANNRFSELAYSLWDLVSTDTAVELLHRVHPSNDRIPGQDEAAGLWAALSLRIPDTWLVRFGALDSESRTAVVLSMTESMAQVLPTDLALKVLEASREAGRTAPSQSENWTNDSDRLTRITLCLARRLKSLTKSDLDMLRALPSVPRAELALRYEVPAVEALIESAIAQLISVADSTISDAHQGRTGAGGYSTWYGLAWAMMASNDLNDEALDLLTRAAVDEMLDQNDRVQALQALHILSKSAPLPEVVLQRIMTLQPNSSQSFFGGANTPELLEIWKLALLIPRLEQNEVNGRLLAASRDQNAQVRYSAQAIALDVNAIYPSTWVESVIVASLYDPDASVLVEGLKSLAKLPDPSLLLESIVLQRMRRLLESSERTARVATAHTIHQLIDSPLDDARLVAIRDQARIDRSWQVRFEAYGREIPTPDALQG